MEKFQKRRLARMSDRPASSTAEEAVALGKIAHELTVDRSMQGDGTVAPCVINEMVENLRNSFSYSSELNDLRKGSRVAAVDIPADDTAALVAQNQLTQTFSVSLHPLHEIKQPAQRRDIVLRPQRISAAKFRRLRLSKWAAGKSAHQSIREAAKRSGDQLQGMGQSVFSQFREGKCHAARRTEQPHPVHAVGQNGRETEPLQ